MAESAIQVIGPAVDLQKSKLNPSNAAEEVEDWIWERLDGVVGTAVLMKLRNNTRTTTKEVFDHFDSGDDYAVTETVVPVRAVRYGDEPLVSRSQAKRLLARVEQFRRVHLDFIRIEAIAAVHPTSDIDALMPWAFTPDSG